MRSTSRIASGIIQGKISGSGSRPGGGGTGYLPFRAISDDIISMARYMGGGTPVTPELIATEVIDQVGQGTGCSGTPPAGGCV
jgi:hypothetical protein